jgi:hypothetical protein
MRKAANKKSTVEDSAFEEGIEWIVARQLVPVQKELTRLRAYVEAMRESMEPW